MTEKQRDYIKHLLIDEKDFGFFNRTGEVLNILGNDWEKNYEKIDHETTRTVINMLNESLHQNHWAWEKGYV